MVSKQKDAKNERTNPIHALCWVCTGMLGERGLGLVVHFPLGNAKINSKESGSGWAGGLGWWLKMTSQPSSKELATIQRKRINLPYVLAVRDGKTWIEKWLACSYQIACFLFFDWVRLARAPSFHELTGSQSRSRSRDTYFSNISGDEYFIKRILM